MTCLATTTRPWFVMGILAAAPVLAVETVMAPSSAQVYFVHLKAGDEVTSPFKVMFGLSGMGVAPAGVNPIDFKQVGHHHLFINSSIKPGMSGLPIPTDDQHLHYGQGQTETMLSLKPGTHTLQLVFCDPHQRLHYPVIASEKITIQVTEKDHEN